MSFDLSSLNFILATVGTFFKTPQGSPDNKGS